MALDLATMLEQIEAAITAILGGAQEYAIGSRRVTKADLKILLDERRLLIAEVSNEKNGTTRAYARWPTR